MNISYTPIHITDLPPAFSQLGNELPKAAAYLLIPIEILYFALYFKVKEYPRLYRNLTFASVLAFWASPYVAPIACGPVQCLQNFASMYLSFLLFNFFKLFFVLLQNGDAHKISQLQSVL